MLQTTCELSPDSPEFADIPKSLRAQHKNAPELVITPKSDNRPKQHQYPLKQEAIEDMKPVFN